ncbi:MAG: hypothetical protein M1829_003697 [Trizodia sp. TS-e1964]|nr:MAG: hypothetical protein M1829_003697 [Trizodia sp. TS-e1964]
MVDYRGPQYQFPPHRKPVPPAIASRAPYAADVAPDYQHALMVHHNHNQLHTQSNAHINSHSRTRTSSSSVFPTNPPTSYAMPGNMHPPQSPKMPSYQSPISHFSGARRTLSNATNSTTGTNGTQGRSNSNVSSSLRRSASSRSSHNPGGYVALMRKQKATVWCDRSQLQDPRMLEKQKNAKRRAANDLVASGGDVSERTLTVVSASLGSSSRGKIRHVAKVTAPGYTPGSLMQGVNRVPLRLSASEVGEDDASDDDGEGQGHNYSASHHQRSGSGRSSNGSNRRDKGARLSSASNDRHSTQTPPLIVTNHTMSTTPDSMTEPVETPVPGNPYSSVRKEYFVVGQSSTSTGLSGGSASSGERENNFGAVGNAMPASKRQLAPKLNREGTVKGPEVLRRKGSVDDRTLTLHGGVRLFVANPDLSD